MQISESTMIWTCQSRLCLCWSPFQGGEPFGHLGPSPILKSKPETQLTLGMPFCRVHLYCDLYFSSGLPDKCSGDWVPHVPYVVLLPLKVISIHWNIAVPSFCRVRVIQRVQAVRSRGFGFGFPSISLAEPDFPGW